jgi:hypothetical protein
LPPGSLQAIFGLPTLFGPPPTIGTPPQQPRSGGAGIESLGAFLATNGLADMLPTLAEREISLPDLQLLSDGDLKELGLKVGPRARASRKPSSAASAP